MVNPEVLAATRRSLHGAAELLLAGPQHEESGTIRLRVVPGGFATVAAPDLAVVGTEARVAAGIRVTLAGRTLREAGEALGVRAAPPREVYAQGSGVGAEEPLALDPAATAYLLEAFALGDAALRSLAPETVPVLWPEHFDLGITLDEVNYGVSPGDPHVAEPYAYVGPWHTEGLTGEFWNAPFGASRRLSDLPGATLREFFEEGRSLVRAARAAGIT